MVNNSSHQCSCSRRGGRRSRDLRCHCGKLLAKLSPDGIVIRCPRCKREMVVSMADLIVNLDKGWSEVSFIEKTA